ncbi:plasmalemma vesicle-associated protein [Suncus etruscus]|uniref:plasmalemma vesicle-associated protein n=1 Tax=Suncus etruscus TaxID=109475 RepID=UPI002110874A|nr:plasmalemma vesicle-associated protein [Suncus etruscus]
MGLPVDRGSPYVRPRHHGCWYYLRYFFLFVSLIQFLIILGLVLFMVYGNVHLGTEKALEATERRAQSLQGQVLGLSASCANLSKELNITARAKDSIMQMMISARRDGDRINISYRQCQADLALYQSNQHILAAIILSEKQCKEQLKEDNRTCNALLQKLNQKVQALEKDMEKGKAQCTLDKESLAQSLRLAEAQAAECGRAQALLQRERTLADDRLRKVQDLCAPLDRDSLERQFRELWKDSMLSRSLSDLSYRHLTPLDLGFLRTCEQVSDRLVNKAEEVASRLRAGIERVARENSELQRQKLQVEEALQACKEALSKAEKEAPARENRARSECALQTQLQLRDKEALRQERDALARELDARRQEVEQLRSKLDISDKALETCIRAKSQIIPQKTVVVPPQPPSIKDINPAAVEEFKKKILESQGLQRSNTAPASSG